MTRPTSKSISIQHITQGAIMADAEIEARAIVRLDIFRAGGLLVSLRAPDIADLTDVLGEAARLAQLPVFPPGPPA